MMGTYLFYDIETSGLRKEFDQVLQFAAIRTDLELNEIERHEIFVKLSPDTIPSPQAVLTHKILPHDVANGLSEYDAICKIHRLLNTPGTISLGYNTLKFDDEFLRFSFYRNMLTPYTHQYANQCSRLDIFPITILYFLFKNEVIKWPKVNENNKVSLKLEHLSAENNLAVGNAHNAIVDVIATIELAKYLQKEPKMWDYVLSFFNKEKVPQKISQLSPAFPNTPYNFREGILIKGKIGYDSAYQCPVIELGRHAHYKNKTLWLRLDTEKLKETNEDNIHETTWVISLKSGEDNFILPLTEKFDRHISQERYRLVAENKEWLLNNIDIFNKICKYHTEYQYPLIPDLDIDAALYQNGFLSDYEQRQCVRFHQLSWEERAEYLDELSPRLLDQAIRIMGRNRPEFLPEKYSSEFNSHITKLKTTESLSDPSARLTPKTALGEISHLKNGAERTEDELILLNHLEQYIYEKFNIS